MKACAMLCPLIALLAASVRVSADDPDARPPVEKADIEIVRRAAQILDSPARWNRHDNRVCPAMAKTFSLYCALEKATDEVSRNFEHRGAAMQEARFVIEEIAPDAQSYSHRLMDYNNDLKTSFEDIRGVFWLLEKRIAMRLANPQSAPVASVPGMKTIAVTKTDLQVANRVRELLDSPEKWDRTNADCQTDAKILSLLCALKRAEVEVTGSSDDGGAIREARAMISELDRSGKYKARLADYNRDPAIHFADLQRFLGAWEKRLLGQVAQ